MPQNTFSITCVQKNEQRLLVAGTTKRCREAAPSSKNRLDFLVNGNVRGGKAVDRESLAAAFAEAEKTADVVILLVSRKKTLGFRGREGERGKGDRLAKFTGMQTVGAHEFAEGHDGSASGSFGAHGFSLAESTSSKFRKKGL